jgi:hypothetical protein
MVTQRETAKDSKIMNQQHVPTVVSTNILIQKKDVLPAQNFAFHVTQMIIAHMNEKNAPNII